MSVKGGRVVDAQEIQAVVRRQRRCPAEAGPIADGSPVDRLPLARAIVPLDSVSDRRGIGGRAVEVGQFGGGFLRAARAVVERDQARTAVRGDGLDELRRRSWRRYSNCRRR